MCTIRLAIFSICFFLVACTAPPAPEATPLPTMEAAISTVITTLYFPAVVTGGPPPAQGYARAYGALQPGDAARLGIEWYYDYGLRWPFPALDNGAAYVPFLWCDQYPALAWPTRSDYFEALAALPDGYSGDLLILNEPDLRGGDVDGWQCDRTPRQAAYIYKAIKAECPDCRLIGPAVSHLDYLQGWPWLQAFYEEIGTMGLPLPDAAAIHDYTNQHPALIVDSLFAMLSEFPGAPGTVWVTEFATCEPDQAARAIDFYTADPRIERYAWFTARGYPALPCINLMDTDGRLTPVGEIYSGRGDAAAAYP